MVTIIGTISSIGTISTIVIIGDSLASLSPMTPFVPMDHHLCQWIAICANGIGSPLDRHCRL
jgi:hypothetical protein